MQKTKMKKRCRDGVTCVVLCTLPSICLVCVVFGTAIPTSFYIFGKCFSYLFIYVQDLYENLHAIVDTAFLLQNKIYLSIYLSYLRNLPNLHTAATSYKGANYIPGSAREGIVIPQSLPSSPPLPPAHAYMFAEGSGNQTSETLLSSSIVLYAHPSKQVNHCQTWVRRTTVSRFIIIIPVYPSLFLLSMVWLASPLT